MTICPQCKPWAATTHRQLINRVTNMTDNASVKVHPCPNCGGTEWAITDALIVDEESETRGWGYTITWLSVVSAFIIIVMVILGWWK